MANVADLLLAIQKAGWSFKLLVEDDHGVAAEVVDAEVDTENDKVVFHIVDKRLVE